MRLAHWCLALCFLGSWATAELFDDLMDVHMVLGYVALGTVAFRLIWGFAGPRHARFSAFLAGPASVLQHARTLFSASPPAQAGHTPLGGWMALALMLVMGAQAGVGLFVGDDVFYFGPYNGAVSSSTANALAGWHHTLFDVLTVLVVLHIAAVLLYQFRKGQNLTASMLTGRKHAHPDEAIEGSLLGRAALIALVVAAAVTALVQLAPPPALAF